LASAEPIENNAIVRIMGSNIILNSIDKKQIFFDFNRIEFQEGENFINLENQVKTPPGIEVIKITPSKLHLYLEKKSFKEVSIKVHYQGKPPNGYYFLKYETLPPKVIIEGAKSTIQKISRLDTEPISLNKRKETFTIDAPLKIDNLNIVINETEPIIISTYLITNPATVVVRNIPVNVISAPERYSFNPQKVDATFVCSRDEISKIEENDLQVFIDMSEIKEYKKQITIPLKLEIKNQQIIDFCDFRYFSQKSVQAIIQYRKR
jgi:YbbR domain-containing protein